MKPEAIGKMLLGIAPAQAEHAVIGRDGNAITERSRQLPRLSPRAGFFEEENPVVPNFDERFLPFLAGDVRAPGHQERSAADSGERRGEALGIGDRRELFPDRQFG